ncbi:MAG TPA: hypothetical protein VGD81_18985 [Opitutaceae bacterium]
MKRIRFILALAAASTVFAGFARADEPKKEGHQAKCCMTAEKNGKACEHSCCVEAAKAGKNCEKCGGKNEKAT